MPKEMEMEKRTGISVKTTPDTLFNVEIMNNISPCCNNGTAACTCAFISAEVSPSTIPQAAKAAMGISKLRPKAEKKSITLFFFMIISSPAAVTLLLRRYILFSYVFPGEHISSQSLQLPSAVSPYFNSGHMPLLASIKASSTFLAFFPSLISRFKVNASRAF